MEQPNVIEERARHRCRLDGGPWYRTTIIDCTVERGCIGTHSSGGHQAHVNLNSAAESAKMFTDLLLPVNTNHCISRVHISQTRHAYTLRARGVGVLVKVIVFDAFQFRSDFCIGHAEVVIEMM